MIDHPGRRTLVAAASMLATLAGAYHLAGLWPAPASKPPSQVLRPARSPAAMAQLATDSAAPAPTRASTPADTVEGCLSGPVQFVRGSPASRRPLQVRHYVGTVGKQPITAVLQWQNPDSITGHFYLHQRGPAYTLTSVRSRPGRPGLAVYQENPTERSAGEWRLAGWPGSRLTGAWWGGAPGQPQAVLLRESYAGAVRLAIRASCLRGGWAAGYKTGYAACYNRPTVYHEFLQLPVPAAVPLALRPLLSPGAAARRRTTRAARNSAGQVDARVSVQVNDWDLLSYKTLYTTALFPGFGTADYAFRGSPLFDLATGQVWPLSRLLRPGYQPALNRLIARHLLHDRKFRDYAWWWAQEPASQVAGDSAMYTTLWLCRAVVPRPKAYVFASEGLELTYSPSSLAENKSSHEWVTTVLVPYYELLPLAHPGTPLARLLRARGLQ